MNPIVKASMNDLRGNPSSTRVKSWYTLLFFMVFTPFFVIATLFGAKALALSGDSLQSYLLIMSIELMSIIALLLTAAFIPSQLNKKTETNEIIELAKSLKKDPVAGEREEG